VTKCNYQPATTRHAELKHGHRPKNSHCNTYQGFAAAWPTMEETEGEFAVRMNRLPKYVASTTLAEPLEWNATLLKGDVPEEVQKLKQQPGQDILIYGSGALVNTLIGHNLIDEYRLMIHPVLLGGGKHLFRDGHATAALRLADTKTTSTGVVLLTYTAAGTGAQDPA
jgi:dihydrofolate reductase